MEQKITEEKKRQPDREDMVVILFGILLGWLIYGIVINQLPKALSDYNGHTYVYLSAFKKGTWFQGWKAVPYCMWHLCVLGMNHILRVPLEVSAAYVTSAFHVFAYFVLYWMIRRYTEHFSVKAGAWKAAMIAFGLSVVQGLYFFWLDVGGRFLGIYSMNPIHNPTHIAVRGFGLLCFCLVYDIWGAQRDPKYRGVFFPVEKGLKKYYGILAGVLFLSAMAKPVFAEMFVPAVGIVMLYRLLELCVKKDGRRADYFRHCVYTFLCAQPALLYILVQFLAYFFWGGSYGADGTFMVTKWMEVWSLYSENIILAVAMGMAFPLLLLLVDGSFFMEDNLGILAYAGYAVGFLEAGLFGEEGSKMSYANFIWPMMCGMMLVWVAAMLRFLVLENNSNNHTKQRIVIDLGWLLFGFHVLCGLLYIQKEMML